MNVTPEGSEGRLVSVALCTYNGSQFLNQQIQSILDQTYKNLELVIVDDCSADDTFELLLAWSTRYPSRFKIHQNKVNLGYNKNFEFAISLCDGEFIAISDQDDIWLPEKIEKLMNAFKAEEIVLTHCSSIHLLNGELRHKSSPLRWEYPYTGHHTSRLFLFNQVQGHNMVFRNSLKAQILPFPKDVYYDWWIAVVATCHGDINAVAENLVYHRMHENNAYYQANKPSKNDDKLYLINALTAFSKIKSLRAEDKSFLDQLILLLNKGLENAVGKIDYDLFKFIYRNRWIIFGHKKRLFPEWTLLKSSFKYSKS